MTNQSHRNESESEMDYIKRIADKFIEKTKNSDCIKCGSRFLEHAGEIIKSSHKNPESDKQIEDEILKTTCIRCGYIEYIRTDFIFESVI